MPITQASSALAGGSADAAISVEPLTSVYLGEHADAQVVDHADEVTDRSSFLIATRDTLDDEARSAALADYLSRLVRSFSYLKAHPDAIVQAVFVDQYGLDPARAADVVDQQGGATFVDVPGDIEDQQQRLADLFLEAGQIPEKVDVSAEFDTRFNDLVREVQAA